MYYADDMTIDEGRVCVRVICTGIQFIYTDIQISATLLLD